MISIDNMKKFKIFVIDLVDLGYDKWDPELKLWHIALTGSKEAMKQYLDSSDWSNRLFDRRVPANEIITRYEHLYDFLMRVPKVRKALNEREHLRVMER